MATDIDLPLNASAEISQIDRVKVLHPTRHKIGHFGDVLPSQSLGTVLKKLNLKNTTKAHIH